jgi:hypothetical protein
MYTATIRLFIMRSHIELQTIEIQK